MHIYICICEYTQPCEHTDMHTDTDVNINTSANVYLNTSANVYLNTYNVCAAAYIKSDKEYACHCASADRLCGRG